MERRRPVDQLASTGGHGDRRQVQAEPLDQFVERPAHLGIESLIAKDAHLPRMVALLLMPEACTAADLCGEGALKIAAIFKSHRFLEPPPTVPVPTRVDQPPALEFIDPPARRGVNDQVGLDRPRVWERYAVEVEKDGAGMDHVLDLAPLAVRRVHSDVDATSVALRLYQPGQHIGKATVEAARQIRLLLRIVKHLPRHERIGRASEEMEVPPRGIEID